MTLRDVVQYELSKAYRPPIGAALIGTPFWDDVGLFTHHPGFLVVIALGALLSLGYCLWEGLCRKRSIKGF